MTFLQEVGQFYDNVISAGGNIVGAIGENIATQADENQIRVQLLQDANAIQKAKAVAEMQRQDRLYKALEIALYLMIAIVFILVVGKVLKPFLNK